MQGHVAEVNVQEFGVGADEGKEKVMEFPAVDLPGGGDEVLVDESAPPSQAGFGKDDEAFFGEGEVFGVFAFVGEDPGGDVLLASDLAVDVEHLGFEKVHDVAGDGGRQGKAKG